MAVRTAGYEKKKAISELPFSLLLFTKIKLFNY